MSLLNDKELKELRYLRRSLSSYQSEIQKALDFLDQLEQKHSLADAPAAKGKRKNLKEERKDKYHRMILRGVSGNKKNL